MKVAVSYLKSVYDKKETIQKIEESSADSIHVDLMDGIFCGEKNYAMESVIKDLENVKKPMDFHLMIKNPKEDIVALSKLNPRSITIPVEISNVSELISLISSYSILVGLSINPETPMEKLMPYLSNIAIVLVMTVHPGKGGQEFMENVLPKLKKIYSKKNHLEVVIDGGINDKTILLVRDYADGVVSGSFVCMNEDFESQIKKLRETEC